MWCPWVCPVAGGCTDEKCTGEIWKPLCDKTDDPNCTVPDAIMKEYNDLLDGKEAKCKTSASAQSSDGFGHACGCGCGSCCDKKSSDSDAGDSSSTTDDSTPKAPVLTTNADGSTTHTDGTTTHANGTVTQPDGTVISGPKSKLTKNEKAFERGFLAGLHQMINPTAQVGQNTLSSGIGIDGRTQSTSPYNVRQVCSSSKGSGLSQQSQNTADFTPQQESPESYFLSQGSVYPSSDNATTSVNGDPMMNAQSGGQFDSTENMLGGGQLNPAGPGGGGQYSSGGMNNQINNLPDYGADNCTQYDIDNKHPRCPKGSSGDPKFKCGASSWHTECKACEGTASGPKGGDQEWCSNYCPPPVGSLQSTDCSSVMDAVVNTWNHNHKK